MGFRLRQSKVFGKLEHLCLLGEILNSEFLSTAETQPCWYSIQEHSCLSNIACMVGFQLYLSSVMNGVKNILLILYTKYMVVLPFPFSLCRCSAVLTTLYK